ncbi:MAG: HypC/HybG/HupF family hydrogenase formation chaperone [Candidatus Pacebacteria bacterium]|nr:HypC/HybG/HupF family hydrogenase formation chaperone [Candidatus Paceibacterota bacterium]
MCLGIPGRVIEIKENQAKVEQDGHSHWLDLGLITEKVEVGDFLLSYQQMAINKVAPREAQKTLKLFDKAQKCEQS